MIRLKILFCPQDQINLRTKIYKPLIINKDIRAQRSTRDIRNAGRCGQLN
jgi:hypothetical protein